MKVQLPVRFRSALRKHPVSRTVIFWIHSLLVNRPWLYVPISKWRWRRVPGMPADPGNTRPTPVRRTTAVVIEGQPRSANTFAVIAFRLAQDRPVEIAHHLHAASQVLAAVRSNVPALVLIRQPEEVVLSRVISHPPITAAQALTDYIRFHEALLPERDWFVLAPFEQVTSDFGPVIKALNQRFGTQFGVFEHTEENVQECFALIESRFQRQGGLVPQRVVAHPSEERRNLKELIRAELRETNRSRLWRAQELFEILTSSTAGG